MSKVVGQIKFDERELNVYVSLDQPLFKATDVADMIEYSANNVWKMISLCEEDETLQLPLVVGGQTRWITFVTENGLYNILAQSRKPIARKWRRIVHDELINARKARGFTIEDQFVDWNDQLDDIYFDEEKGVLMRSVTVAGGDVEQVVVED